MNLITTLRILNPIVFLSLSVWKPLAVMLMFDSYMTLFNIAIYTLLDWYMTVVLFVHHSLLT